MTTAAELRALAEEVEGLSGPDREMNVRIACALFPITVSSFDEAIWADGLLSGTKIRIELYTASIDAAASLMPEGKWRLSSEFNEVRWCACAARWDPRPYIIAEALAATEPLARCAAALRARAAVIEAGAKAETVEG